LYPSTKLESQSFSTRLDWQMKGKPTSKCKGFRIFCPTGSLCRLHSTSSPSGQTNGLHQVTDEAVIEKGLYRMNCFGGVGAVQVSNPGNWELTCSQKSDCKSFGARKHDIMIEQHQHIDLTTIEMFGHNHWILNEHYHNNAFPGLIVLAAG